MNKNDRNRYYMFTCVDEFGATNAAYFPAGSIGATQFAVVGKVVSEIQNLIGDQTTSRDAARFHYATKATMRENLRAEVPDINETSRSMPDYLRLTSKNLA